MRLPVIDVHTHLHPPRLSAAIRRWFAEKSPWLLAHPTEPTDVAAVLRAAGVERFVFFSYAHRTGMARTLNAWLGQTARELDRFGIPLGTVHLDDPAYLEDLRAALDDGCAGIKIHEDVQRFAVDDPRFTPVFEELERREAIVIAHVGPMPWREEPGTGPLRVDRVLTRHPGLSFIVAHMGLPDTAAYFAMMPRHPNLYLDTTMALAPEAPGFASPDIAALRANAGRVLYGTDYPNIPYAYGCERRGIEGAGLDTAQRDAVLGGNARRLLRKYL